LSGIRREHRRSGAPTLRGVDALAHHLLTQAYNNAWANHRLLGACAQLSAAEFAAPRTGFFPSIKATLNHSLTVDWYYLDALERSLAGRPPNAAFAAFYDPEEPFDTCVALREAQSASDRRLIALCAALDGAALGREITVPRAIGLTLEPLPRLLAHLFQHQVHHRGQAHSMLSGTRVAPPQLDEFFCTVDAPLRAPDLRALGLDEAALWRAE
jgi:uncharacterized damage-inducible protein DinB